MAKWHVRVSKQSCKQGNRLILWASEHQDIFSPDLVIVVFHGEYKRTVTDTLKLSHCRAARTMASAGLRVEM
jgi:hypothetical protein